MKITTRLRATERLRDTWALKAPQVFPLLGDGYLASSVTRPLRGGHGRWRQVLIVPTREALVDARYRDWLAQRDQRGSQPDCFSGGTVTAVPLEAQSCTS
jgi:hypothetical protein